MFDGFRAEQVEVGEASIFVRHGGDGPPVLLLHGHPRTSATWHRVAPRLVERGFTVVCPDLRGYGRSTGPAPASDHTAHSKRVVAGDHAVVRAQRLRQRHAVVGHAVALAQEPQEQGHHVRVRVGERHEVAALRATLVLYESGPRLGATLAALAGAFGPRDAAVAREISKLHEECVTGTLVELAARYADEAPRGEIVIVVGPPTENAEASDQEIDAALDEALARTSVSRAAAEVAEQFGVPRKRVYARALERGR